MYINRVFDEIVEKVTEMQIQDECLRKLKLKLIFSRNVVLKVVVYDNDEFGFIEVKGKRIRDRKKFFNERDKVVFFKENLEKEVLFRKKLRKKRIKFSLDQIGEFIFVELLLGRKVLFLKNILKVQFLFLLFIKLLSIISFIGNRNSKKVIWRN